MCRCGTAPRSRCIKDRTPRNVVVVAAVTDVRRRVINAIRRWLKEFFYDFQESPRLLERVSAFIDSDVATCPDASIVKWVEPLKKIIAEQVSDLSSARSSGPVPVPVLIKSRTGLSPHSYSERKPSTAEPAAASLWPPRSRQRRSPWLAAEQRHLRASGDRDVRGGRRAQAAGPHLRRAPQDFTHRYILGR